MFQDHQKERNDYRLSPSLASSVVLEQYVTHASHSFSKPKHTTMLKSTGTLIIETLQSNIIPTEVGTTQVDRSLFHETSSQNEGQQHDNQQLNTGMQSIILQTVVDNVENEEKETITLKLLKKEFDIKECCAKRRRFLVWRSSGIGVSEPLRFLSRDMCSKL